MEVTYEDVKKVLTGIHDPTTGIDLAQNLTTVDQGSSGLEIQIVLGYPAAGLKEELEDSVRSALVPLAGDVDVAVRVEWEIRPNVTGKSPRTAGVKNVIAVASGKGGVGKSTIALNLALALQREGAVVGLLDGDIYGPSMGKMLGAEESLRPQVIDENTMAPVSIHGLQCMSLAFVMADSAPAVWRGPMASGAFKQLLQQTRWQDVDYLVVDLPPGTGDIQLTLAQQASVSGAVIVTTPQDIALLDAIRGIEMFRSVEIPVIGVVENMSVHVCTECGHREHLFGEGGGAAIAARFETELLAEVPLNGAIRSMGDNGTPALIADPGSEAANLLRATARKVGAELHKRVLENRDVIQVVQIQEVE